MPVGALVECEGGPRDGEIVEMDSSVSGYEYQRHEEIVTTDYYNLVDGVLKFQRTVRRSRLRGFGEDDPWQEEIINHGNPEE